MVWLGRRGGGSNSLRCWGLNFLNRITGGMILAADYSQLELRVLAHLSKDQRLLQVSSIRQKILHKIRDTPIPPIHRTSGVQVLATMIFFFFFPKVVLLFEQHS